MALQQFFQNRMIPAVATGQKISARRIFSSWRRAVAENEGPTSARFYLLEEPDGRRYCIYLSGSGRTLVLMPDGETLAFIYDLEGTEEHFRELTSEIAQAGGVVTSLKPGHPFPRVLPKAISGLLPKAVRQIGVIPIADAH